MENVEEKKSLAPMTFSPDTRKKKIQQQLDLEKQHYENEYSTCCSKTGKTDARLIQYGSRFTMSVLTLAFAGVQLIRAGPCDALVPFYSSLITFILGVWLKENFNQQVKK